MFRRCENFLSETAALGRLGALAFDPAQFCRRFLPWAALAALWFVSAPARAGEALREFEVPAGEAAGTLKLAARQGGLEIAFFAETVQGVRTAALRGRFAPREALARLVAGTELELVAEAGPGPITVRRRSAPSSARGTGEVFPAPRTHSAPDMKTRTPLAVLGAWFALALTSGPAATAADGSSLPTGSIAGRVYNATVGNFVNNARVVIDGTRLETFTDEFGAFTFPRVPAGLW